MTDIYHQIAEEFDTPTYIYDVSVIKRQFTHFTHAFTELPVKVKYASKALTNPHILREIVEMGSGIDAVSINEAKLAILAGATPSEIMYSPNGVSLEELDEGVALGVQINIDNLSTLEKFGRKYGNKVPVCIRLNPHIMAGGNMKISTGHIDSKFGISQYQVAEIVDVVDRYNLRINGLHVHTGSDIHDAEVFVKGAEILFKTAIDHFPDIDFIDFGSGFKVPYKPDDLSTDIDEVARRLKESYDRFTARYGKSPEIWFEPGKFLVSEAGGLLVKVNVVKKTPVSTFVAIDSGLNHLIRPMMYDAYHDIVNLSNPQGNQKVYNVVGYICETDTFAYERQLHEVREGDLLLIKNAGAYGFAMSSQYNSRFRPAEVMIREGKIKLIRERETFDDLLSRIPPLN